MNEDIADIEKKLTLWKKQERLAANLMEIPGVGILSATAAVATIGDAGAFRNGREFAAFLGLVPRQSGTLRIPAHRDRSFRRIVTADSGPS